MEAGLAKYLKAFKKLRIDRSHGGAAPHKPILLLSICQAFEEGLIAAPRIYLTLDLVALFKVNWNLLVTTKHECRITYPFFYMKSEGFWRLITYPSYHNFITSSTVIKGFNQLKAVVDYALIDEDLFLLLSDGLSNKILQQFLLDEYFPSTKIAADQYATEQSQLFNSLENKILNEDSAEYGREIHQLLRDNNEEEIFLRSSMFKREIPKIYNNSCCISRMNIIATSNISMVDACHIIPFSISHDDTIANGITLCPNLHRAFDRGLIAVGHDYRVLVSKQFKEANCDYTILRFEGQKIHLPMEGKYWPAKDKLTWHRENVFVH